VDPKTGNSLLHLAIKNQNATVLKELLQSKTSIAPINANIINEKDG
jgi:ankyrin repeat protein